LFASYWLEQADGSLDTLGVTDMHDFPIPPRPVDEAARLATLDRYRILDTPPEKIFDRITRLAATLFGMPIALISLIDERRQWFKSRYGIEAPSTDRDVAFCAYTILGASPLVVPDALEDARFASNPFVIDGPRIRFYAGAPLKSTNGYCLGSLCVVDTKPHRDFDADKTRVLQDLADLVIHEMEGRKAGLELRQEIEEHRQTEQRLEASLREKEILLREIHHRVKNNLQAIWGMLQVEKGRLRHNPEAQDRLDTISQRLNVLGRIHQQLYASGDLTRVDMAAHLQHIAQGFIDIQGTDGKIAIMVEADTLYCDLEVALPLGLIAHELVLNSVKHAYPGGKRRPIRVKLSRRFDGPVELTVSDEGVGRASSCRQNKGIGTMLVDALVGQVGANISYIDDGGCCARLLIPEEQFSA
jgi:two-component sensor histidine kinase